MTCFKWRRLELVYFIESSCDILKDILIKENSSYYFSLLLELENFLPFIAVNSFTKVIKNAMWGDVKHRELFYLHMTFHRNPQASFFFG